MGAVLHGHVGYARGSPSVNRLDGDVAEKGKAMTATVGIYDWVPGFARGFVRDLRVRWRRKWPILNPKMPRHPKWLRHKQ